MATPLRCQLLFGFLLLLLVAQPPGAQGRALRSNPTLALPDYSVYHHKDDLLAKVAKLVKEHPDIMSMVVRSAGDQSYNVTMQVVDVELGGPTKDVNKARFLVDFGEHAREYISSELGIQLLQTLANPAAIKALVGGGERGDKLMAQLHKVAFKILPMENERGRDLVEAGRLCERKNGRGVDPNRNWEVDWGKKEPDYDAQEEYPGLAPFSEPESRIVLDLAKSYKPHVWLNIHSGMEAMFTPWDHKGEVAEGAKDALHILNTIKDNLFTNSCVVGSGGKSVGYLAHGTATDYMFEKLKVPLPYTWEIFGDFKASFNDCFRMFNPLTQTEMQSVVTLWLKAIFRLVELLPTHPAIIQEAIFTPTPTPKANTTSTPRQKQQQIGGGGGQPVVTAGELDPSGGATEQPTTDGAQASGTELVGSVAPGRLEEGDGTILLVTPLHVLKQGSVWTTLVVGIAGVALVGALVYRLTFKARSDPGMSQQYP